MKKENYMYAAKMNGVPLHRMISAYILPNIMGNMVVTAAMDIGSVILSMAGLSFLGLGAARPTAEWGAVMSEARDYLQKAPWIIVFNGIALFVVVTGFQLFGDRLSDFMNKKNIGR
jgi:peptide/nickel transport system permease protein